MWQEAKQLSKRDQLYLGSMVLLLVPPVLFSLGVARGIFWHDDSLTFSLLGRPGNDEWRSLLFVLIMPIVAALSSVYYLIKYPSVHRSTRALSWCVLVGCCVFLAAVLGYLVLENLA